MMQGLSSVTVLIAVAALLHKRAGKTGKWRRQVAIWLYGSPIFFSVLSFYATSFSILNANNGVSYLRQLVLLLVKQRDIHRTGARSPHRTGSERGRPRHDGVSFSGVGGRPS